MSFLQHVGDVARKILHIGIKVATVVEPEFDILLPGLAAVYHEALGLAAGSEALMGSVSGTGPQKLSAFVTGILPSFTTFLTDNNIQMSQAEITEWADAFVQSMNKIKAPSAPPAPSIPDATGA